MQLLDATHCIWIKLQALLQQLLPCEEEGFDDFVFIILNVIYELLHEYSCLTIKIDANEITTIKNPCGEVVKYKDWVYLDKPKCENNSSTPISVNNLFDFSSSEEDPLIMNLNRRQKWKNLFPKNQIRVEKSYKRSKL